MNKKITIIDYEIVNLASVANALTKLEIPFEISGDPDVIKNATILLLPGVGSAEQGMKNLKRKGLDKIIIEQVKKDVPILGICCGMQLLFSFSEEGNVQCLNLIKGEVKKFQTKLKVPQIGWNTIKIKNNKSAITKDIPNNSFLYFANSYFCDPDDKTIVKGSTEYETKFCSILESNNIFGAQFHPEKSGKTGLQLLKNFWEVACK